MIPPTKIPNIATLIPTGKRIIIFSRYDETEYPVFLKIPESVK